MIILQREPAEHRDPGTSAPQGEPGTPPSVLTPQSPCTATRAVGVGTLYQDTIYAAADMDKADAAIRQPGRYHPRVHTHTQSRGVITPVGSGHLPKGCMRARGSHACRPIRGLLRPPATSVGAVGLCGPCSSRQGRAPLCPHRPTWTRKGQWDYKIFVTT